MCFRSIANQCFPDDAELLKVPVKLSVFVFFPPSPILVKFFNT